MNALLALPVALPLFAAGVTLLLKDAHRAQQIISLGVGSVVTGLALALTVLTAGGDVHASRLGGFPGPVAISLVADALSALLLLTSAVLVVTCIAFAVATRQDAHRFYHPLVLVLLAGVANALLTSDLFNLFVAFEVMLIASYVLLVLRGNRDQVRAGAIYVTTNLAASTLLVLGVGLTYALAGTVNFARLGQVAPGTPGMLVPGAILLVSFGVKSALVPVHGWLPRSYPATSPAVAALFAGLLTKVGVYALYRTYAVVFGGDPRVRPLLLVIAAATMFVGVMGAVARDDLREILSFHITSQVGYMLMGLALFGPLGLAAGVFFVAHNMVVKTSLFLSAGAIEHLEGAGRLKQLGGAARRHPILASAFGLGGLAIAGLPPMSGFYPKLGLVQAAFADGQYLIGGVSLVVSLLTLTSMVKIWNGAFWGEPAVTTARRPLGAAVGAASQAGAATDDLPLEQPGHRAPVPGDAVAPADPPGRAAWVVAPALFLGVLALLMGLGADVIFGIAQAAAEILIDPSAYIDAVLGGAR